MQAQGGNNMKRYKLKKNVRKAIVTAILVVATLFIYSKMGYVGELAQTSRFYEGLAIFGWAWIIFINPAFLAMLWD